MVRFSRGLLIILVITALISCAQAATVYGTIYSWSDFKKIKKGRSNIIIAESKK